MARVETLLPPTRNEVHPVGCHRQRVPDRLCFEGILIPLVTDGHLIEVGQTTLQS